MSHPVARPPAAARRRRRPAVLLGLAVLAGLLTGCRIDLVASVAVERDGSGSAGLEVVLDGDAVDRLDELAFDPFAELTAAALEVPDWSVERASTDDGGLRVRLRTAADDPDALTAALADLSAGLGPDDPSFDIDLDLEVAADGAAELRGRVEVRPPATAGARRDGEPVGPAGDELAAIVAEALSVRLEVSLPGRAMAHDADAVAGGGLLDAGGSTLTWDVPVGTSREVSANAAAPPLLAPWMVAAAVVVGLALLAVAAWWWRRRRRVRRR